MSRLAVVVDSGAGFPKEWYEQHRILVAQHSVAFRGKEPINDLEISPEEFYSRLRESSEHPKTANPNPAKFAKQYDVAFENSADNVVVLTMMKNKSGAYNSAVAAAKNHKRAYDIIVFDSHTSGPAQAFMALDVSHRFERRGISGIEQYIEQLSEQTRVYMVPEDIGFLASSGRVQQAGELANLPLSVTAIISIMNLKSPEGKKYDAIPISKHRTQRQALDAVVERVKQDAAFFKSQSFGAVDLAVVHAGNQTAASNLESQVRLAYGSDIATGLFYSGFMTPVLGRQFGPGTVGVAMLYRES